MTDAQRTAELVSVLAGVIVAWNEFYPSLTPQDRAEECEFGPLLRARFVLGRLLDPPLDHMGQIDTEAARLVASLKDGVQ